MKNIESTYFKRNQKLGQLVVKNLEQRNFEAYFVNTGKEAVDKTLDLMETASSVAWGGSATLGEIGIFTALYDSPKGFTMYDRDRAAADEKREILLKSFDSDYYLMSTNALCADGQLVNIDGNGNRVAALMFGPRNVIVIVSVNKIEKTLEEAISRARNVAAPANSMRFNDVTPCTKTGLCHSCKLVESVCANIVVTRLSKTPKRIKVIIVGEEFGF